MRTFFVRNEHSRYHGEHSIYDNVEEAYFHNLKPKKWFPKEELEVGDWIEADDGGVMQLLGKRYLKNRHGQITWCFTFCNGIVAVYYGKKTEPVKIGQLYAFIVKKDKSCIGDRHQINAAKTEVFARLVIGGMDIFKAYHILHKDKQNYISQSKILELVESKRFRRALMQEVKTFQKELDEKLTNTSLVDEIVSLIRHSVKGSKEHRENLMFAMKLKELLPKDEPKRIRGAFVEIEPEQELPPAGGTNTLLSSNPS